MKRRIDMTKCLTGVRTSRAGSSALVALILLAGGRAEAASKLWTGAVSSDWSVAGNWSPAGAPVAGDTVTVGPNFTVDLPTNATIANLMLDQGCTLKGTGNLTATQGVTVRDATLDGTGNVTIPAGGLLRLIAGTLQQCFVKRKLINSGTVTLESPYLNFSSDWQNNAGGVIDIKTDALFSALSPSNPTLSNAGIIRKSAGTGTSAIGLAINNTGTIEVKSGVLKFNKAFTQTSGTTNLNGGHITAPSGMTINGGTLEGVGTINGNVVNNGSFKPGHSPGTTTINGNYTQGTAGVLDMEIGGLTPGTGYDQLVVTGQMSLSGTLNVLLYNGYLPGENETYQLLVYDSSIGNFSAVNGLYPGSQRWFFNVLGPTDYTVTSHIDSVLPAAAITAPLNKGYASLTTATGTASDTATTGSGLASVTVLLYRYAVGSTAAGYWAGGTSWSTTYSVANERTPTGSGSWSVTLPTLGAGAYWIRATARDKAGNVYATPNTNFWIDSTVPATTTFTAPTAAAFVPNFNTVSGTATDNTNGSGIARVDLLIKRSSDSKFWTGTAWSSTSTVLTTTVNGTTWSRSTGMPTGTNLVSGGYTLTATAYDQTGNSKAASVTCTVDVTAPTIAVTAPKAGTIYTTLTSTTGTAADTGGSALNNVTVALYRYGNASTTAGYWGGSTSWTTTYSATTSERAATGTTSWSLTLPTLAYGAYTLRATAKDKAGNITSSAEIPFWKSSGTSTIGISTTATASTSRTVKLTFNGALDAKIATDPLRYTVTVGGVAVAVQSATYSATTNTVTLTVSSLTKSATVVAAWNKLFDTGGKILSGQTGNLTAQ